MTRQEFASILHDVVIPSGCSQEKLNESVLPLSGAVVQLLPERLFRYRQCCDKNTINALKEDKVYAVTANLFNDPYDCLVKYDINSAKDAISRLFTKENLLETKAKIETGEIFQMMQIQNVSQENVNKIIEFLQSFENDIELDDFVNQTVTELQEKTEKWFPILSVTNKYYQTVACFSETISSITMWSHYANYHKGFALGYDMHPLLTKPILNVGIYPVIYDNQRFDATAYMLYSFMQFVFKGNTINNPDMTASLKCSLHKSDQWAYEKEWRLIDSNQRKNVLTDNVTSVQIVPNSIYYGQRISKEDRLHLHTIAEQKGLEEYDMYIDPVSDQYEMLYRPFVL